MQSVIARRSALFGLAGSALAMPHIARAAPRTVRLGHNNSDASHYGRGAAAFALAAAAEPALADRLVIEVHGNAELGDELGLVRSCAAGTLDLVLCAAAVVGNVVPEIGIVNAPFLFRDIAHARVTLDGPPGLELAKLAALKGLNVLAWGKNAMRQFTANIPIRVPQDLHGLKVRVPQSAVIAGGIAALGADPAPLPFGLLREALRTGQFDGQENGIVNIETLKLYELQKYLSLTSHIYDAGLFMAATDFMDDLTAPQRDALGRSAQIGAAVTGQLVDAAEHDGIVRLRAAGMTVIEDVDVAAFKTASQPYLKTLSDAFGAGLVGRLRGTAA